jgi:hypothetical protein
MHSSFLAIFVKASAVPSRTSTCAPFEAASSASAARASPHPEVRQLCLDPFPAPRHDSRLPGFFDAESKS